MHAYDGYYKYFLNIDFLREAQRFFFFYIRLIPPPSTPQCSVSAPTQTKGGRAKFSQLCFLTVQTRLASGHRPLISISKLLALSAWW